MNEHDHVFAGVTCTEVVEHLQECPQCREFIIQLLNKVIRGDWFPKDITKQ